VAVLQRLLDGLSIFHGRFPPDLGIGARTQTFGEQFADLDLDLPWTLPGPGIGVGNDELDPFRLLAIMLLMALPPAPPTPMTLIFADFSFST
jgi:8-oxo-dGTP pyrophosphatase MutT (NUDIX family)